MLGMAAVAELPMSSLRGFVFFIRGESELEIVFDVESNGALPISTSALYHNDTYISISNWSVGTVIIKENQKKIVATSLARALDAKSSLLKISNHISQKPINSKTKGKKVISTRILRDGQS